VSAERNGVEWTVITRLAQILTH